LAYLTAVFQVGRVNMKGCGRKRS